MNAAAGDFIAMCKTAKSPKHRSNTAEGISCARRESECRSTFHLTSTDYLIFVIAAAEYVNINLVGVLTLADILLSIAFIYLAVEGKIEIGSRLAGKFLVGGLLWLCSQIITDIVRHSAFADYARGWSLIGLTLVNFCVLCTLLYGRPRRLMIFGWGAVAGQLLHYFIDPYPVQIEYPWKFGLAYPISAAVALIASRKACRGNWPVFLMTAMGVANILLSARNAGGVCLAAALYLGMTRYIQRKTANGARLSSRMIVVMVVAFIVGTAGIFSFYEYAAGKGLLGADSREKYQEEASGKYGVLLGGRTELLASIPAIIDSPILGHGSWAKDPGYLIAMKQAMLLLGYPGAFDLSPEALTEGLIPTHSFLLGAWVNAGILGGVFWAWAWLMVVRSLARVYPPQAIMLPFMAYVSFLLLWDILFSPFGLDRRCQVPFFLIMIMTYYDMAIRSAAKTTVASITRALKPALSSGSS